MSAPVPAGDAACAKGGASFSVGGTMTYACNGADGVQGPAGPAGAQGPAGPAGPQGPTGVVQTVSLYGWSGGTIAGNSSDYVFAGPTGTVTTTASQRLIASGAAALGLASGSTPQAFILDFCYRPSTATTPPSNFAGVNYIISRAFGERRTYAANGTTTPGAGTWTVGLCVKNEGAAALTDNDYVNGWVMVTN